jgi:hypothetical protein
METYKMKTVRKPVMSWAAMPLGMLRLGWGISSATRSRVEMTQY